MLHRVFEILKVRWPEAVMLIGTFGGLSVLAAQITREFYNTESMITRLPFGPAFLMGMGLMALIILLGMLFLGFLRSMAIEPLAPQQPMELLRLGRPYFWRLFLPYMVFELAWTLLAVLLITILHFLCFGKVPAEQIPDWLLRLSQMIGLAILIKPFLLIPTIILLKSSSIREALVEFRTVSLLKMHHLVKTIWIGYALLLAVFLLVYLVPFWGQFLWIRLGILSIVAGSVFLFFFLTAMLEIQEHIQMEQQDNV